MNIKKIIKKISEKKILIIGDLMLDHYIKGKVERVSAEAPVPVVDVQEEEFAAGGAANVAMNIKSLNSIPFMVGVTGNDSHSTELKNLFLQKGIKTDFFILLSFQ